MRQNWNSPPRPVSSCRPLAGCDPFGHAAARLLHRSADSSLWMQALATVLLLSQLTTSMSTLVRKPAPAWKADAVVDGDFATLSNESFKGSWHVIFFYPLVRGCVLMPAHLAPDQHAATMRSPNHSRRLISCSDCRTSPSCAPRVSPRVLARHAPWRRAQAPVLTAVRPCVRIAAMPCRDHPVQRPREGVRGHRREGCGGVR